MSAKALHNQTKLVCTYCISNPAQYNFYVRNLPAQEQEKLTLKWPLLAVYNVFLLLSLSIAKMFRKVIYTHMCA